MVKRNAPRRRRAQPPKPVPQPPLIWERLRPKPAAKLDLSRLVAAAVSIADTEGLGALSMRRLATRLGTGAMSLYRHVQNKDDVHDLILDEGFGEITVPAATGADWRADLRAVLTDTRRVLCRHPWLPTLLIARPTLGPNYLRWFEFLLAATARDGRAVQVQVRIVGTLWAFVTGFVAYEVGELENNRRHGLTEEDKRASAASYVAAVLDTGEFPHLARMLQARVAPPSEDDFEFGLTVVLDGLEAANGPKPYRRQVGGNSSTRASSGAGSRDA
jgi:AcrR family transcriptional regulator